MSDNYIQEYLNRIVAMQKEALAGYTPPLADAKPFWPYAHEMFPYTTNRLGVAVYDYDHAASSEDAIVIRRPVYMRLCVAHITAGMPGEKPDRVAQYIGSIEEYFLNHPMLDTVSGDYTDPPRYLMPDALITGDTGIVVFDNRGIIVNQLGVEFTLELTYIRSINEA